MKAIVGSRWDTDAYKLSMGQVFWKLFRNVEARYQFVDRRGLVFPPGFVAALKDQIDLLQGLQAEGEVTSYIEEKWPFLDHNFLDWYTHAFRHNPEQVNMHQVDGRLNLTVEGPILEATHWEIPLLRIISTLYNQVYDRVPKVGWVGWVERKAKFFQENGIAWLEFGGRRPHSPNVHRGSLAVSSQHRQKVKGGGGLIGTSWVKYAYEFGLMLIGTQAHEYAQMMAAIYGYKLANLMAMHNWVQVYRNNLGYALSDTFTTPVFLRDFNYAFANMFEGTRQDSGDPKKYTDLLIDHYCGLGIDPKGKSVIYSNSLSSLNEIKDLQEYRPGQYRKSFGIGGFITNDVGYEPYNFVIKLTDIRINGGPWIPTVKLSDDPKKAIGDPREVERARKELGIQAD